MKNKFGLTKVWKKWLTVVFVVAVYHLLRDIFQEFFKLSFWFTDFLHFVPDKNALPRKLQWLLLDGYSQWLTFPVEIFLIWAVPKAWKKEYFATIDALVLTTVMVTETWWLLTVINYS
ncbi:MAG: hypothetical protein UX85_C0010G0025 [Candidatus Beckwithbacteria bacterium GW2011_GWB1_47_15]|uniref:Uncharacterized protein n=1 Tax=Candidatus Beckwithbacteria bacterium GW2011_GWB1_47_15 TaxID=1618371 RepID=A0A0G1RTK3_9BACT|nr:MAG: hypothetical protein UY43_C0001G0829 [Candidatus Beckwithbacteria bacterium GW2011_GWC1_49_16]AQS30934.1 hypothetical protein [uncultured bacterium]KKU34898.1 MAG: hypothetical protein UX50_C0009G0025 [Candidatus Beckwithbacteria bacterium GW2011_GWA1_46_30]KKU60492.1 MAG: hypothetical protein UX85_C0010G0025 [Candidatus Beckwithbacteria bacterium GW2011_GWB1_47_15]KKU72367.1 MAG: hypothetical protein UX97_C0001G0237 [Candidatus Beckwithbacteria bacterium GW2011_GWA2_47_25]OGD48259.1 M